MLIMKVVIDTSVWISALITKQSAARDVLRMVLKQKIFPQMNETLFLEYESVMRRRKIKERCPLSEEEVHTLFQSYLSQCTWNEIYYLFRPNLKDENDNFLIELAVASGSKIIVTYNPKDFDASQLTFDIRVVTPELLIKEYG